MTAVREIRIGGVVAEFKRSTRRKTIGLKVHNGRVSVSAPPYVAKTDVERFVLAKACWIREKLERQQQAEREVKRRVEHGAVLPFLDEQLTLALSTGSRSQVVRRGAVLEVTLTSRCVSQDPIRSLLKQWYREQAIQILPLRVAEYGEKMGLRPAALRVREYKSRWGSCSHKGELQFNWLLMLAPAVVVDYVVVHELSHLKHFNHSAAFWQVVEQAMPGYQRHRQWLKSNGLHLRL